MCVQLTLYKSNNLLKMSPERQIKLLGTHENDEKFYHVPFFEGMRWWNYNENQISKTLFFTFF